MTISGFGIPYRTIKNRETDRCRRWIVVPLDSTIRLRKAPLAPLRSAAREGFASAFGLRPRPFRAERDVMGRVSRRAWNDAMCLASPVTIA